MRKNDNVEDGSWVASRRASGLAKSGSDRGQFVDVIDENASRAGAVSESVEWSSGRSVVIFNFSIKAQVGRLMVAICSSACVSAVDLTSNGRSLVARNQQRACNSSELPGAPTWDAASQILFGAAARPISGTNIKIGRWTLRWSALSLHLRDDGIQEETGLTTWRWAQRGHVLRRITYNPISVSLFLFPFSFFLRLSSLVFSTSSFCSSSFLLFIFETSLLPRTDSFRALDLAGRPLLRHRRSACRPSFWREFFIVARRCLLSVWEHATFHHYRLRRDVWLNGDQQKCSKNVM